MILLLMVLIYCAALNKPNFPVFEQRIIFRLLFESRYKFALFLVQIELGKYMVKWKLDALYFLVRHCCHGADDKVL